MTSLVTGAQSAQLTRSDPWAAAAADWLQNFSSSQTRRAYRSAWRAFLAFLEGKHPAEVTQHDVIAYRGHLDGKKRAPATINLHLAALSSFYKFTQDRGLADANPADGVRRAKVQVYGRATLLDFEAGDDVALLQSIDTSKETGARDLAIILLMLAHGLRVSEVASLQIGDLAGKWLTVTRKGGKVQTIGLGATTRERIDHYRRKHRRSAGADEPLFVATARGRAGAERLAAHRKQEAQQGRGLTARAIRSMISRRCTRALGEDHEITPHSLRHTAASKAEARGQTVTAIGQMLGHEGGSRATSVYLTAIGRSGDRVSKMLDAEYGAVIADKLQLSETKRK